MGYMTGYVCSPQQWAYVRVTGALAAAAVHSPLLTMVSRFCNLPTATSTVHVATVPPLIPPGPPTTSILILSNRRRAALAPEGKKLGCQLYPGYIKIENAAKRQRLQV